MTPTCYDVLMCYATRHAMMCYGMSYDTDMLWHALADRRTSKQGARNIRKYNFIREGGVHFQKFDFDFFGFWKLDVLGHEP